MEQELINLVKNIYTYLSNKNQKYLLKFTNIINKNNINLQKYKKNKNFSKYKKYSNKLINNLKKIENYIEMRGGGEKIKAFSEEEIQIIKNQFDMNWNKTVKEYFLNNNEINQDNRDKIYSWFNSYNFKVNYNYKKLEYIIDLTNRNNYDYFNTYKNEIFKLIREKIDFIPFTDNEIIILKKNYKKLWNDRYEYFIKKIEKRDEINLINIKEFKLLLSFIDWLQEHFSDNNTLNIINEYKKSAIYKDEKQNYEHWNNWFNINKSDIIKYIRKEIYTLHFKLYVNKEIIYDEFLNILNNLFADNNIIIELIFSNELKSKIESMKQNFRNSKLINWQYDGYTKFTRIKSYIQGAKYNIKDLISYVSNGKDYILYSKKKKNKILQPMEFFLFKFYIPKIDDFAIKIMNNQSFNLVLEKREKNALNIAYDIKDKTDCNATDIGLGIAGNAGRLYGNCLKYNDRGYYLSDIKENHRGQEESIISAIVKKSGNKTNKKTYDLTYKEKNKDQQKVWNNFVWTHDILLPQGELPIKWGMKIPNSDKFETLQNVIYTDTDKNSNIYYKCEIIPNGPVKAYTYENKTTFNIRNIAEFKLFISAGPQASDMDNRLNIYSTMKRTEDKQAAKDYNYFKKCIKWAIAATLKEMKEKKIKYAIIPGFSTGIYRGIHEYNENRFNKTKFFKLLTEVATGQFNEHAVDYTRHFTKIIYSYLD